VISGNKNKVLKVKVACIQMIRQTGVFIIGSCAVELSPAHSDRSAWLKWRADLCFSAAQTCTYSLKDGVTAVQYMQIL